MKPPADASRPFFAYGLFRPGQLAFFQLREFVSNVRDPVELAGVVRDYDRVRDSLEELLPIFRAVLAAAKRDAALPVLIERLGKVDGADAPP